MLLCSNKSYSLIFTFESIWINMHIAMVLLHLLMKFACRIEKKEHEDGEEIRHY